MNSVKLSTYYRLYAFSDYRSMKASLPYMRRVVLAKQLMEVEESEARKFMWRVSGQGYKNYLEPLSNPRAHGTAMQSLVSALQLLYKSNGYSAKYIAIERGA